MEGIQKISVKALKKQWMEQGQSTVFAKNTEPFKMPSADLTTRGPQNNSFTTKQRLIQVTLASPNQTPEQSVNTRPLPPGATTASVAPSGTIKMIDSLIASRSKKTVAQPSVTKSLTEIETQIGEST